MRRIILTSILIITSLISYSQLTVQNGFTAQQLGNNLAGSNISVTNATISGTAIQFGTFQYNGTDFPLSSGVVLSNGSIFDCPGPNSSSGTSTDNGGPGSSLLDAISGMPTHDAVELKFDFTVQTDKIEFKYIFGSEEYNEYVGSFNDVFAFFISGPGITGEENIALVPNTDVAVAINNINLQSYWQYYNNNESGTTNIEFDGYTTVLTAKKEGLIPCETYTLKLIIADAGDGIFDTGVFLQENSLVQGTVSAAMNSYSANDIALEGCINASFTFSLDSARLTNTYIHYKVEGSATNGIDYTHIDTTLVIAAGQTDATVIIDAKADGIFEGQESVMLIYEPVKCQGFDTIVMYIEDYQPLEFETIPSDLSCFGSSDGELDFVITGGTSPYSFNIQDSATGIINTYASYPITGLSSGTYMIQVLDSYGCWAEDVVSGGVYDADTTFLPDGNGVSYSTSIEISGMSAGQTLEDINQLQSVCLEMEHSFIGDLLIQLEAPGGTMITLKEQPGGAVTNMGEPVASGPNDSQGSDLSPGVGYLYCFTADPQYGTMVSEANSHSYTYVSQTGVTLSDKYLPEGTYQSFDPLTDLIGVPLNGTWTIHVTDEIPNNNGYIFNWSISVAADKPDSIVTLSQPVAPEIVSTTVLPSCGLNNGSVSISVTGGSSPFTFLWSNGSTDQDILNLGAGTYSVTVTDNSLCSVTKTVSLPNSSAATVVSAISHQSCVGINNGSIDLTVSGGTPPYTYLWSTGLTSEDISSLSPGNYSVQISDNAGCISAEDFTINPATQIYITGNITNENCGNIDGAIDISVLGGVSPYSYLWSDGNTLQDNTGLQQGAYSITVSDANGCTKTSSYNIVNLVGNCIPTCDLEIQSSVVSDEVCGNQNGSIQLGVYSTNLPYFVSWSNGSELEDQTGLTEGTYIVTITDAANCSVIQSEQVNNLVGNLAVSSVVGDENCGNSSGSVNITPTGGVLPYFYSWSNGSTNQDISGLSAGTFYLTLTDGNSCAVHESFTVNNNSGTLQLTYGNAMNSDCGQPNGSVDITISGGVYPISYLWSNGAYSQDIIGLTPGFYSCTITDGQGCSIVTPIYEVGNNAGTFAFTYVNVKNEICSNGSGEVKILCNGGAAPYSYAWSNGGTTQNIYNLSAGIYSGTVTDNNGCSITTGNRSVINVPGTLSLENIIKTNEICSNGHGSILLEISGGAQPYSFSWSNGSVAQNLYNLSAGTYSCVVSDTNSCTLDVSASITNDQGTLYIANLITNDEICGNSTGSINLITSGGTSPFSYAWSSGQTTEDLYSLSAGSYSVTIVDSQGCQVTGATQVSNQSGDLSMVISSVTNEVCSSGTGAIDISVSGGTIPYSYNWSNGSTQEDLSNLSAGTYSCIVTDSPGCIVSTGNININNSAGTLVLSLASSGAENCGSSDGFIDINVSGVDPKTYIWTNGSTTQDISGLIAGSYTVTVTDANGCSKLGAYSIGQSSGSLAYSNVSITNEVCGNNAGSISLVVSGGLLPYTFIWSNGSTNQNISGISAGNYTLTVTDANGCGLQTSSMTVNDYAGSFTLVSLNITEASCGNNTGSVNAVLTGGVAPISYSWSNGGNTQNLTGLYPGVYNCTATDNNGCELVYSTVVPNDAGNMTISASTTNALCGQPDGSIDITITGGASPFTYSWSNGSTNEDLVNLAQGNYTVYVEDINGCYVSQTYSVASSGNVVIAGVNVVDENCGNALGEIEVNVTGGVLPYQFDWSSTAGTSCCSYTLEMIDYYGDGWNDAYVQILINGATYGYFTIYSSYGTQSFPVCNDDVVSLVFISGFDDSDVAYSLKNSGGTVIFSDGPYPYPGTSFTGNAVCTFNPPNSNTISNLSAGNYVVEITDANGCSASTVVTVANNSGGFSIASGIVTSDFCDSGTGAIDITVTGGTTPYQYIWSTGSSTQDLSGVFAGDYSVTVTSSSGCVISQSYTLTNNSGTLLFDTAIVTDTYCGNLGGAIDISASGTELPLSFLWNNGATTEDLSGIPSGDYSVTITDATGCSIYESFEVMNQTNGLAVSFSTTEPLCGDNSGEIIMDVTGGVLPYSVLWSNAETDNQISGLSAGIYSVSLSDAASCMITESIELTGTGNVSILSMNITDEYCGYSDGSITVTAGGGLNPYVYNWSVANSNPCCNYILTLYDLSSNGWNGNSVEVFVDGVSSGVYSLYGEYSMTYYIPVCSGQQVQLVYNEVSVDNENYIYFQDFDGNLLLSTGPDPIDGVVYTGVSSCEVAIPSSGNIYNLSAGAYIVTITDANGCTVTDTAIVNNNTNGFVISNEIIVDDYCNQNFGSIDLQVTGGYAPYEFYWSNGVYSPSNPNLSEGIYTVTIYDYNYCMIEKSYTITNDPGTLSFGTFSTTDTYCGNSAGAINISAYGASGPFAYQWSNGATDQDLAGIVSGQYDVTVTDASGCQIDTSFTIINNTNGLSLSFNPVMPTCGNADGSIDMTIAGGNMPYSVIWNTGSTSEDISGLEGNSYTVSVTDADLCMTTETIDLNGTGNVEITTMNITDEYCGNQNGAVTVSAIGTAYPFSYQWSLVNGSSCCEYGMYLYDAAGDGWNGTSVDVLINGEVYGNYTLVSGTYILIPIPVCTGDNLVLVYHAGMSEAQNYVYLVDAGGNWILDAGPNLGTGTIFSEMTSCDLNLPNSSSINGLSAGNYVVFITDANGCTASDTADVINNTNGFEISSSIITDDYCTNNIGSINISITGGLAPYQYYWSNGASTQDISGLSAGNYSVMVYDNNYCMLEAMYTISDIPGTLAFGPSSINDTYCGSSAGSIDITVNGDELPFVYSWSNGATTEDLNNILAGQYSVSVVDASGCSIQETYDVVNMTNGLSLSGTTSSSFCGNNTGSVNLLVTGGIAPYSYLWNNGETTEDLSGISGGSFVVTVTDNSGCASSETFIVDDTGEISIATLIIIDEVCDNNQGEITVIASGGTTPYDYSWTQTVTEPCCMYTLEMYDSWGDGWNGGYLEVFVNGISSGMFSALGNYSTDGFSVCSGDQIVLYYTSGSWEEENTYSLLNSSGDIIFTDGPNPSVGSVFNSYAVCDYSPQNTNHLSGLNSGDYNLVITEMNGCSLDTTITVGNSSGDLEISSQSITNENCGNGQGAISISVQGGASPYSYSWSNGSTAEDLYGISAGDYTIDIFDNAGCSLSNTFTVLNNSGTLAINSADISDTYCGNSTGAIDISVSGGVAPYSFLWSSGATTEDISSVNSGLYSVTMTDNTGCAVSADYEIANQTNGLVVDCVVQNEMCGNNSGNIILNISGGVPLYWVNWSTGSSSQNLSNLSAGDYSYTVTDNTGCSHTETVSILNSSGNMVIVLDNIQGDYCGWGYGAIGISVQGGTIPVTYSWSNGYASQDIADVIFGIYTVTATDNNGCTDVETYEIPYTPIFEVIDTIIQNVSCGLCSDGSIDIATNSGTTVTYQWSNSETTEDIYNLSQGSYTVTITDEYGCTLTETYLVPFPVAIDIPDSDEAFSIFPNPTTGIVSLTCNIDKDLTYNLEVLNMLGEIIYARNQEKSTNGTCVIDLKAQNEGVYIFRIKSEGAEIQKRVVLIRE